MRTLPLSLIPFVKLPRRRRRDLYVSLRWRITQEGSKYGGKFTTDQVLDEPERPRLYKQSFDVFFLGSERTTIWNMSIRTAAAAFWSKTHEIAHERAFSLLSKEQIEQECRMEWEGPFVRDGKKYYAMVERRAQSYDCFGGLTLPEYQEKSKLEVIENEPPEVFESLRTHRQCIYGLGLQAVIQADEINREVIQATIERFREVGETDWQGDKPVSRECLPFETREMALSQMKYSSGSLR
jgi:hypothetical protein